MHVWKKKSVLQTTRSLHDQSVLGEAMVLQVKLVLNSARAAECDITIGLYIPVNKGISGKHYP